MKEYFVTFNGTYNEEFEIFGFSFMDEHDVKRLKKILNIWDEEISYTIGSRELYFENGEELLDCFTFKVMKDGEKDVLRDFLEEEECTCTVRPSEVLEFLNNEYEESQEDEEEDFYRDEAADYDTYGNEDED